MLFVMIKPMTTAETPESGADFLGQVREYVRLRRAAADREAQYKEIKAEADKLEQRLLDDFASNDMRRVTIDGVTVYLHRQLWAQVEPGVEKADVLVALRECGHDEMVTETYNSSTVSAWLRELEAAGEELPEALHGLLGSTERFTLRTIKA